MNYKHLSAFAAVVPLCLLAGGVAFAQNSPQSMQQQTQRDQRNRSMAMPPPVDSTGVGVGMTNDFDSMAGSRGYVTRVQARRDRWLNENFATCDSNGDREVSRAEYMACRHPQSMQDGQQMSGKQQANGDATTEAFDRISGATGYVTEEQLAGVAWLRRHFNQCDDNGDGKLNRAEYRQCHRNQSMHGSSMHSGSMSGQQDHAWQQQSAEQPQSQQQSSAYPQSREQQSSMDSDSNQQQSSAYAQSTDNDSSSAFSRLAGSKGYVTRTEAGENPWMQQHFTQCDDNNDGKLNRAEYEQCQRQQSSRNGNSQSMQSTDDSDSMRSSDDTDARHDQSSASAMNSRDAQSGDTNTQDNFDKLAGNKGFVTALQAAADPWMKRHFAQCDRNADGKLSRTEYDACTRQ